MATLGDTSEPTNSAEAYDNAYISFGHVLTFPGGGPWLITGISVWLAGYGETSTCRNVVWSGSSGLVLVESATYEATQRSFTPSGSDLYTRSVSYVIAGGSVVIAGVRRDASEAIFFGKRSSGSYRRNEVSTMVSNETISTGAMGVYLTYTAANSLPSAPTWVSPAQSTVLTDLTPNLVFNHVDADGDPCASYDIEVDTTSGDQVVPDWSSLFQSVTNGTGGISGNQITFTLNTISRGQWYAARVRTNDGAGDGAWSSVRYFKGNSLPTITGRVPS